MTETQIVDLNCSLSHHQAHRADVCVIGAGAAGIYVGVGLMEKGFNVALVEAGDFVSAHGSTLIGADVGFVRDPYHGATAGRYFGVGGTTTQWGGFLIPHTSHDLRPGLEHFDAWTSIVRTVSENSAAVLKKLGWRGSDGFASFATQGDRPSTDSVQSDAVDVVCGLMLPHTKKNFSWLLKERAPGRARISLFCNAVVTALQMSGGSQIHAVRATSPSGNTLQVDANQFVVAAGAIESARLLLELNRSSSHGVVRRTSAVGCFLADHLSVPIAVVEAAARPAAIKSFAPRFEQGWMRTFRFLEKQPPVHAPRAYAHFSFDTESPGFTATKEMLRAFQSRRRPHVKPADLAFGLSDMAKLGFHRFARRRLHVRPDTEVQFQLDVEQLPVRENKVTLSDRTDRYGRSAVDIHWQVSEGDIRAIDQFARQFLSKWPQQQPFPRLRALPLEMANVKPHDAYHPVGLCRLGRDSEAVVDENLKVWGVSNLWVVSTGVLPSAGTANPTFTMLCLGEQLVQRLLTARDAAAVGAQSAIHV